MKLVKTNSAFTGSTISGIDDVAYTTKNDEIYLLVGLLFHNSRFGIQLIDLSCRNIFIPFFVEESNYAKNELNNIIGRCFIELDKSNGS